jgi:23S rRNA A1618 N6-methylase RlmF
VQISDVVVYGLPLWCKKENLSSLYKTLNKVSAVEIKLIDMAQGQNKLNCSLDPFLSAVQQKTGSSNKTPHLCIQSSNHCL